jgi:hypothetical protein
MICSEAPQQNMAVRRVTATEDRTHSCRGPQFIISRGETLRRNCAINLFVWGDVQRGHMGGPQPEPFGTSEPRGLVVGLLLTSCSIIRISYSVTSPRYFRPNNCALQVGLFF